MRRYRLAAPALLLPGLLSCGGPENSTPEGSCMLPALRPPQFSDLVTPTMYQQHAYRFVRPAGEELWAPVQPGVREGAITPAGIAVVGGRVQRADGQALPCATVTVVGHPEFGSTQSRDDGRYAIAVNGPGIVTLQIELPGYLPAQRQVAVRARDYAAMDTAVMVRTDSVPAQAVDLAALDSPRLLQLSSVADRDGSRRAAVLVSPGTVATRRDTGEPLRGPIHLRAIEFTRADQGGLLAMPAPVAPNTDYTFAVEMLIDEAPAGVSFNQPVVAYFDNFLRFSIGGIVPVGSLNRETGIWEAEDNGRVIRVLGRDGDRAIIDVRGRGVPASPESLRELGISDGELRALAEQPAGAELWRVPMRHFSAWDCNWNSGPPLDALFPRGITKDSVQVGDDVGGSCASPLRDGGLSVDCAGKSTVIEVAVAGRDKLKLNYRSDRVEGHVASQQIRFPLIGQVVPASLVEARVQLTVNGERVRSTVDGAVRDYLAVRSLQPMQQMTLSELWDGVALPGVDAKLAPKVSLQIGYVYPVRYYDATINEKSDAMRLFGTVPLPSDRVTDGPNGREQTVLYSENIPLDLTLARSPERRQFFGFGLNILHGKAGDYLVPGDGSRPYDYRATVAFSAARAAGAESGVGGYDGDSGTPESSRLARPVGVAFSGSTAFVGEAGEPGMVVRNCRLRQLQPGLLKDYAGKSTCGVDSDGGTVTNMPLVEPRNLLRFEDLLFFTDKGSGNGKVRIVYLRGPSKDLIYTLMGNGTGLNAAEPKTAVHPREMPGFAWNGIAARRLSSMDPTPSVYVSDETNHRIRRIDLKGDLSKADPKEWSIAAQPVIGGGAAGSSTGAASGNVLSAPAGLAFIGNALYIADAGNHRLLRVPDVTQDPSKWQVEVVAGSASDARYEDSAQASNARFRRPTGLAAYVSPSGAAQLYITDIEDNRVRRLDIRADGTPGGVVTVAGGGPDSAKCLDVDPDKRVSLLPTETSLKSPDGIAVSEDGSQVYVADTGHNCVRRLVRDSFSTEFVLSADQSERYYFNADGLHRETRSSANATKYIFNYKGDKLTEIQDYTGGGPMPVVTSVLRPADNKDCKGICLVHDGAVTQLVIEDGARYVSELSADGKTYKMIMGPRGLLDRATAPSNSQYQFAYDRLGRFQSFEKK